MLLAAGCKVDLADEKGRTPMMRAAIANHAHIVRRLLDKGAESCRMDNEGKTALQLAEECNSGAAAALLHSETSSINPQCR